MILLYYSEVKTSSLIEINKSYRLGLDEEFPYNSHKADGFSVQNGISYNVCYDWINFGEWNY